MITIFHWDLPNFYQVKYDGWKNETIVDEYLHFASTCFELWGDKVNRWITFNEPWVFTELGYGVGVHAPNVVESGSSDYKIAKNVLLAHAKAYHHYHDTLKLGGKVGITLNIDFAYPRNEYKAMDW